MKKIIYTVILIIILIGCKKEVKNNLNNNAQRSEKIINEESPKSKLQKIIRILPDSIKQHYDTNLFNKNLTSLSLRDEKEKDIYKKYEIDFNHLCYPSAVSLFIDCINQKIYVFEFDDDDDLITEDKIDYILNIKNILYENGQYTIVCNELESFFRGDYNKIKLNNVEFNFIKLNSTLLYKLKIKEQEVNAKYKDLFGGYKFYVKKEIEDKFHKDDCDDFDG